MNNKLFQSKRRITNQVVRLFLLIISSVSILFVGLIVLEMVVKGSMPFLPQYTTYGHEYPVNFWSFITGFRWIIDRLQPYYAFGIGYMILDTLYIVFLTLCISLPMSLMSAIYIVKMSPPVIRNIMTSVIELLAAIPSILFGVFGSTQLVVYVSKFAQIFGINTAGGLSTLSAVLTLSIMTVPTITSIIIVSLRAVDTNLEKASFALGASKMQTYLKVLIPASKSGIIAAITLGIGRAIGEATAVAMVSGNSNYGPTFGLFSITSTLASKMLVGIKEASGVAFDIRFSMGLVLIVLLFCVNLLLSFIKKRIRDVK